MFSVPEQKMNENLKIDFDALGTEFEEEKPQITEEQLDELPFDDWNALAAVSQYTLPTGGKILAFLKKYELETITTATSLWIQQKIGERSRGENASLTTYKERMMDTGYTVHYEEAPKGFYISDGQAVYTVGPSPLNHSPTSGKVPRDGHKFMVALTASATFVQAGKFVVYEGFAKSADIKHPEEFSVTSIALFVKLLERLAPAMTYIPRDAEGNDYIDYIDRELMLMEDDVFYPFQDLTLKYFFPTLSKTKKYGESFKVVTRKLKSGEKVLLCMIKPFRRLKTSWSNLTYIEVMRFLAASRAFRGKDNKGLSNLTSGYQLGGLPTKEAKRAVNVVRLALPIMKKGRQVEVILSSIGDMAGVERSLSKYAPELRQLLVYRMSAEDKGKVDKMWKDRITVVPIPTAVLLHVAGTAPVSAKKNDEVQNLSYEAFKELQEGHRLAPHTGAIFPDLIEEEDVEETEDVEAAFGGALPPKVESQPPSPTTACTHDQPPEEKPVEQTSESLNIEDTKEQEMKETEIPQSTTRDFILYMKVQCDTLFTMYNVYPAKSCHALDAYVSNLELQEAYVTRDKPTLSTRPLNAVTAEEFLNMAMRHNYERNTAFLYAFVWSDYVMNFWVPRKRTHTAKLAFEFGEEEEVEELPTQTVDPNGEREEEEQD